MRRGLADRNGNESHGPRYAAGVIEARLGRGAQDALEAAVVLEAWGGVGAGKSFSLGSRGVSLKPHRGARPRPARAQPIRRDGIVTEAVSLTMAILAVASWAGPLGRQVGGSTLARAIVVALPITLSLQWAMRSRYLSRDGALGCLARDYPALCTLVLVVATPLMLVHPYGSLAALLVAIWVGGTVLARRGWALAYGLLLVGALVGLEAGLPAYPLLAGLAAIILAGNVIAVLSSEPAREPAGPVGRALWAGATGGALGGLLVGDPSVGWGVHGAFPAVALLPSVLGSVWGGYRLWKFSDIVPRGLHGVALQRADARDARGPAMRILAGSLLRLVGTTIVLSGVVIILVSSLTSGADRLGLFVGFGCVALVTMLVNLLDSLGHPRLALVAAAASVATELVLSGAAPWRTSTPGTALILGAVVGTLIALPVLLSLSLRPGRVLATRLWVQ